jgi:hypothetical protein
MHCADLSWGRSAEDGEKKWTGVRKIWVWRADYEKPMRTGHK